MDAMQPTALLHGIWSVVGNTLVGAGLILSLVGLARSVGFSLGLLPTGPVRVNSARVIVDALAAVGFIYVAVTHLVSSGSLLRAAPSCRPVASPNAPKQRNRS
jgi:hypothetical protein